MEFRIADTFTASLAKLNGQEQKQVKTTAFDLQLNPANPGMQFHKLAKSKDPDFWSVRVSSDIRVIVHKTASSLLLCYTDHHDAAYAWAQRRKIERHPKTGAAQLVTVRERVQEVPVGKSFDAQQTPQLTLVAKTKPLLFPDLSDDDLLAYGVPAEWLDAVRSVNEDTLFELSDDLPQEAMEALLDIATGTTPQKAPVAAKDADPFAHPDAQRRFRLLEDVDELARALDYPWEKWTVFLHPAQRHFVERDYNGPARVAGSAGTGKTIVALHRAVLLAKRNPSARVLLTTFSTALANALSVKLDRLAGTDSQLRRRIQVSAIHDLAETLYSEAFGAPELASEAEIRSLLASAAGSSSFQPAFLISEWRAVVDAWQINSWDTYRDVPRLGRKKRISGNQREQLWAVFEQVRRGLERSGRTTRSALFARLTGKLAASPGERPFAFAVVDEAQDMGIAEMRFLAAIGGGRADALFFAGDLGQRIFQQPFSWKSLGVDVRGRSHTLRINYRTSHQIRTQADKLLPSVISDVDGNDDSRRGTQSVFNGPAPAICVYDTADIESAAVGDWLKARLNDGVEPHEIGVFVRSEDQLDRARSAVSHAGLKPVSVADSKQAAEKRVTVGTMHQAKGLEFRAVAVMACDDEVLPLQARIETVIDDSDLSDVYNTERHLLYVACTRARDWLLVSGVDPASEFLDDMS